MYFLIILETPYFVERTLEGKNLPVYTEYRRQGTTVKTIIRRIYGDVMVLIAYEIFIHF